MIDAIDIAPRACHDPRAANGMTQEHKFAHAMLERWATWAKDSDLTPWPKETVMSRIIRLGPDGAAARGFISSQPPEDIAIVDRIVMKLVPRDSCVIRKYYLEWKPQPEMAAELCLKEWQFSTQLRHARQQVAFGLLITLPNEAFLFDIIDIP